jgi:hypothetical protein
MRDETRVSDDVPTTGDIQLPPNPRSLEALARHHSLEAALAELVDNSVDAGARHVLIRFVRNDDRLGRLLVVDDGVGMAEDRVDIAMTVGGARGYRPDEIGRFGLGLKAASFSQARSVTVLSRAAGSVPVGRRWQFEHAKKDFRCEIVAPHFAASELRHDWELPHSDSGTIVRWDNVKAFPSIGDADAVDRFIHGAFTRIGRHLGLIFHRLLERQAVRMLIDVEDVKEGVGLRTVVPPLNPFGYPRSGAAGWPKMLGATGPSGPLNLRCHIWPGRSNSEEFRLDGRQIERQGLYIYFNDRLVQQGGWNGLVHEADKQLNLARVELAVQGDVDRVLALKPEKNGIEVGPEFESLVHRARASDGTTFAQYIERTRGVLKESNRRRRERPAILPPGAGFDPRLKRTLSREYPIKNDDAVDIRWARLETDDFFDVDREQRVLWLNSRYRKALLGGRRGGLNDLPVLKALLFLLTENIFAGQNLGPRDKDNLEAWQSIMTVAAKTEL